MSLALAPCCCTDCERAIAFPYQHGYWPRFQTLHGDPVPCWVGSYYEAEPTTLRGTNWLVPVLGYDATGHRLIGLLHPAFDPEHPDIVDDRLVALRLSECEWSDDGAGMPFDVLLSRSAWNTILDARRDATSATYESYAQFFHADAERLYGYSKYLRRASDGGTSHLRLWSVDHTGGDLQFHRTQDTTVFPSAATDAYRAEYATVCRGQVLTVHRVRGSTLTARGYRFYRDDDLAWFESDFNIPMAVSASQHYLEPVFWLETTSWAIAAIEIVHALNHTRQFGLVHVRTSGGGGRIFFDDGAYPDLPLQQFFPRSVGYDEANDHVYITWSRARWYEDLEAWGEELIVTKITGAPAPGNLIEQSVVETYRPANLNGPHGAPWAFSRLDARTVDYLGVPHHIAWSLPIVHGDCPSPPAGTEPTIIPPDPGCECVDDTSMWVRLSGLGMGRYSGGGGEFRPDFQPIVLNEDVDPDCVGIDRYWHVTWAEANGVYRLEKISATQWEWRGGDCDNMRLVGPRLEYTRYSDTVGVAETMIFLSAVRVTATCTLGRWDDPAHASISFEVVTFSRYKLHSEEEFPAWSCTENGDLISARVCTASEHRRYEFCGGLNESRVKWERFEWDYFGACDVTFGWSCPTGDPNGYIAISTAPLAEVAAVFPDDDLELPV